MKYSEYEKAFSPARLNKYLKACGGDSADQIHGTWGGLALIPGEDDFIVIGRAASYARRSYLLIPPGITRAAAIAALNLTIR